MGTLILIVCVAVGGFGGWQISRSYKKRLDVLSEVCDFLSEALQKISQFGSPLEEILDGYNFKTAFKTAIKNGECGGLLYEDEVEIISKTLREIPSCERDTVIKKLENLQMVTAKSLEQAKSDYAKKGIMIQKLGILFGLLIGVLWL